MGVHGLWDIVGPAARPVRLEGLNKKRLAVDASIWIYQFLKAVRDSEGNQLRNSHIVGFYRRICKILFFGIQPVFVFDGGAPVLKRQTISKRKQRREGKRETAKQTAQKLLAQQLQKIAEQKVSGSPQKNQQQQSRSSPSKTTRREVPIEDLQYQEYYEDNNYFDGQQSQPTSKPVPKTEEKESKMFRRQDDYHLPTIDGFKVDKDDKRMITDYEYDRLVTDSGDLLDGVDLDRIDPQSAEFAALPLETQYIALSHLRLRSRLRMGYTKEQLETLFPRSIDFSKFQIQMVQKRNYLTQRLMNVTGMDNDSSETKARRIAGDKDRAYEIQKNDSGWTLSILGDDKKGQDSQNAINLDPHDEDDDDEDEELGSDIEWENVTNVTPVEPTNHSMRSFMDPSIHSEPIFVANSDDEEEERKALKDDENDDATMATIRSLYEYAAENNKKDKSVVVAESQLTEEEQLEQMEQDELRQAIEKSKQDLMRMQNKEINGSDSGLTNNVDEEKEPPIILSKESFKDGLDNSMFSGFSMSNSLLMPNKSSSYKPKKTVSFDFTESINISDQKSDDNDVVEIVEEKQKPKPQPMPLWFEKKAVPENHLYGGIGYTSTNTYRVQTDDEKAGLISFNDLDDYLEVEEKEEDHDQNDVQITGAVDNIVDDDVIEIPDDEKRKNDKQAVDSDDISDINESDLEEVVIHDEQPDTSVKVKEVQQKSTTTNEAMPELPTTNAAPTEPATATATATTAANILTGKQPNSITLDDYEFSEDEEEELETNLQNEEVAYEKFVDSINTQKKSNNSNKGSFWSMDDEVKLQEELSKQKRDSDEVTIRMVHDVQDLLSRFGIPFITAPMEAEAQCAELFRLGLVDGIITDDSDCFLFGGDRIYKNMFKEKNFVECYQLDDIERDLGLTRTNMIELAMLLGSDYTEGLKGIGKVTAMEILADFKNLTNFRDWWIEYQNGNIDISKESTLRKKLRKSLNKSSLYLSTDFPDKFVNEAYMRPEVDHDKTEFKWGYPNLDRLRTFLMFNVGWNQSKIDESLLPVIKSLNKPQTTIEEFFPIELIKHRRDLMLGKRLKDATSKLKNTSSSSSSPTPTSNSTDSSKRPLRKKQKR
ncbi:hypothetical protein CANARDRAFT_28624 [[Candida] arabinofermentans NRRL YB-2248]|uniref:PIN domain-like protein n=1 Tax=[Candida] arabinofermentans NRRL YB-2248 TaxID=983967 RepID=A0A1E4SZE9_9ASCO|nr:hypothetical protein CANARDRAFT_28624 [[Candida] arabinofermentans NRRL YB-2248]